MLVVIRIITTDKDRIGNDPNSAMIKRLV